MIVNSHNIEFGYELIAALPYAYWLRQYDQLDKTISGHDTQCLYWFSPEHEINPEKRSFNNNRKAKDLPNIRIHKPELNLSQWLPPPLQEQYSNDRFVFEKPILCICNRVAIEWLKEPVNFFTPEILDELYRSLKDQYQIVYFNIRGKEDYYDDDIQLDDYDMEVAEKHGILTIHDLHRDNPDLTFNRLQLMVMANSKAFITMNGGYSILASYMGGTNIIYSRQCREIRPENNSFYRWYHLLGGSRVVHVNNYDDLVAKVKSIYVRKDPLINILIRTSGRPNYFRNCIQSIYDQDYHNWNVVVGVDDTGSLPYVQPHKCKVVRYDYSDYKIPPQPALSEYGRKFKYNLYFNDLHDHVNEGYIIYLDDDNVLSHPDSLSLISEMVSEDSLLFFRAEFPMGRLVPSHNNLGKAPVCRDIDTACFCFHHKHAITWEPYKLGDYRVASQLWSQIDDRRFLNETITRLQRENGHGGFGRRDDLPDRFTCPICSHSGNHLKTIGIDMPLLGNVIGAGRREAGCPGCGSSDRERLIYLYLLQHGIFNNGKNKRILHVAPEKRIYKKLAAFGFSEYVPCDLDMPGMIEMDITDIPYERGYFDLIICNHVLEHIPDDRKAMRELYRVLKKNGTAILQVPLRLNHFTYEDPSITDPKERLKHFGQDDHVRIYGARDYCNRLGFTGFNVDQVSLNSEFPKAGLNKNEQLIIGRKL